MTVLEKSNDTVTGNEAALKFAYDESRKSIGVCRRSVAV